MSIYQMVGLGMIGVLVFGVWGAAMAMCKGWRFALTTISILLGLTAWLFAACWLIEKGM